MSKINKYLNEAKNKYYVEVYNPKKDDPETKVVDSLEEIRMFTDKVGKKGWTVKIWDMHKMGWEKRVKSNQPDKELKIGE